MTTKLKPLKHGSLEIERVFQAAPETVFSAWSDIEHKAQWFIGPNSWTSVDRKMDFRVGGEELLHGRFLDGTETVYTARYHDIQIGRRLIYVYDMHINASHLSTSLATVEFQNHENGSKLVLSEQATYLDGEDGTPSRLHGTSEHFDRLQEMLLFNHKN